MATTVRVGEKNNPEKKKSDAKKRERSARDET